METRTPWKRVWSGFVGGTMSVFRSSVPGGWFVMLTYQRGTTPISSSFFYPDPAHGWDGSFDETYTFATPSLDEKSSCAADRMTDFTYAKAEQSEDKEPVQPTDIEYLTGPEAAA